MLSTSLQFRATLSQAYRSFHISPFIHTNTNTNPPSTHNPDTYSKDIDSTPPPDSSIHRVDPSSESVQKPHEAPSGPWSRAGTRTKEYESVSKAEPYAAPGEDRRYGGKETYPREKGPEMSGSEDGPQGKESAGRKPEGRT